MKFKNNLDSDLIKHLLILYNLSLEKNNKIVKYKESKPYYQSKRKLRFIEY